MDNTPPPVPFTIYHAAVARLQEDYGFTFSLDLTVIRDHYERNETAAECLEALARAQT